MSWQDVLSQQEYHPASTDPGHLIHLKPNGFVYPLTRFTCLAVEGPDRFNFLQGQVTCDMKRVEQGEALLGAHLNLQGRIEAAFILFPLNEQIVILIPDDQADHLKSLLEKYLMFAKAELKAAPEWLGCLCWSEQSHAGDHSFAPTPIPHLQFKLLPTDTAASLLQDNPIGIDEEAFAIMARYGFFIVDGAHRGTYLPQEINYDRVDGISFNKGCYKGQEVVARLHFKGQVKQRLTPFHCPAPTADAGRVVNADNQKCGEIVQQSTIEGGSSGCALIKVADWESKSLFLEQNDGPELQLLPLPYAIT